MPEPLTVAPDHTSRAPPVAPYPIQQAITTPRSWAHRGNWGLKRDLPVKRSRTTEFMRYDELDTINHMTTFESAHDTVYTHRKWQEMDVPITKDQSLDLHASNSTRLGGDFENRSTVFDSDTAPENYKWRYASPYTNTMTDAEITEFIEKKVRSRRQEFLEFVARKNNYDKVVAQFKEEGRQDVTPEEIQAAADKLELEPVDMKKLRAHRMALESLVAQFLDMPIQSQPYTVHPSGGLHYTRSNAHMVNDPERGPQEKNAPVPGRELNLVGAIQIVGVAGVTAAVQRSTAHWTGVRNKFDRMTIHKYRPLKAHLDPRGKIMLEVEQVRENVAPTGASYWNPYDSGNQAPNGGWSKGLYGNRFAAQNNGFNRDSQPEAKDKVLGLLGRTNIRRVPMGGMSQ